jgi:protocatechuate 3,4-dioxygenase beta subunit
MESKIVDRRKFLKLGAGVSAGALAMGGFLPRALAATCGLTPPQTEGPFYPGEKNFTAENDLTRVPGAPRRALGSVVYINGTVTDQNCRPLTGANVEIWQACESGSYNNAKDPNPAPRDPYFKYWGETFTDDNGKYSFKTIIPGAYPADEGWVRPAHIHYKVSKLGYHGVTTQMYFKGDPWIAKDLILLGLSPEERERVIVDFQPVGPGMEPGTRIGTFDISIRSVRA